MTSTTADVMQKPKCHANPGGDGREGDTIMNTTPSMTMERADAAASTSFERTTAAAKPATGSFQTVEPRLEVMAPLGERYDEILTPEALAFLAELHDRFAGIRHELLA